jgi:folate-binding protein YgfZ
MTSLTQSSAALFDRSDRLRMQFTGPDASKSLTGLVTNDVLSLRGGDGLYACALTAKGRIIADVRILALATDGAVTSLIVDANAASAPGFAAMIRKYVNPRTARYVDISADTACLTLSGPEASRVLHGIGVSEEIVSSLEGAPSFSHRMAHGAGVEFRLVRVPDLGDAITFDLHCARDTAKALQEALLTAGASSADATEWHRRRVIAARPEWGVDMDESTLAQEANMDALHAISYQKGCYTGQETVARVHFRGHVNRTLRCVSYGDRHAPGRATPLLTAEGATVGDARSTAISDAGTLIGLAMVRREIVAGTLLCWVGEDGVSHPVEVVDAPLD